MNLLAELSRSMRAASPAPFTTTVPAAPPVPTQPFIHPVEKPYKLSKQQRRPSIKSTKSTSGLSFHSISSSFGLRSSRNRQVDEKIDSGNREIDDDYAMVERDGRVSNDGGKQLLLMREIPANDAIADGSTSDRLEKQRELRKASV